MKRLLRTTILLLVRILGAPRAIMAAWRDRRRRSEAYPHPLRLSTPTASDHVPHILLIRPDHLGDMLLVTPILQAIKERVPNAHMTMMVGQWSADIVERHPAIDNVITCLFPGFQRASQKPLAPYQLLFATARQFRRASYDLAINLRPDFWWGSALLYLAGIPQRIGYAVAPSTPFLTQALTFPSAEHATVSNLRLASAALQALGHDALVEPYTPARYPLYFKLTQAEQQAVRERLQHEGITDEVPLVVIHPGTGGAVKLWRTEGWAHIANWLASASVGTVPCACPPTYGTGGQAQGTVPTGYQIPTLESHTAPSSTPTRPSTSPFPGHLSPCEAEVEPIRRGRGMGEEGWGPCDDPGSHATTLDHRLHARIVLTGSPKERTMLEEIAERTDSPPLLMTNLTVGQLAALLARAQLVLGVDNGPLHMAVAQDTPSIRIYGPTDAHVFGPWGDARRHIVIASKQKCADCPFIPCNRLDFSDTELPAHPCVRVVREREVEAVIVELIGKQSLALKE